MSAFTAFTRKELREIVKTWRLWVLPGVLLFIGLTNPVITAATPYLLKSAARQPGVIIKLPPPTAVDSYAHFTGDLSQLALLALIITGAAVVAGERRSGTAALMLTKPLTRAGFIAAKAVSGVVTLLVATALGAALCIALTVVLFDASRIGAFLTAVVVWLALAAMFTMLMLLLSAVLGRQASAAGVGIVLYVVLLILSGFPAVSDRTPAGLLSAGGDLLGGRPVTLAVPLAATLLLAGVFLGAAVAVFRRQEI